MGRSLEVNLWPSPEHALDYLRRADSIPHRVEGETALLEFIPTDAKRILDLGSGDGRLLALVIPAHPSAELVALDFSPLMLDKLRQRFGKHSSPTPVLHRAFLTAISREREDPSNKLRDLETQLTGLRDIGFANVDCHWKWREFALFAGARPGRPQTGQIGL